MAPKKDPKHMPDDPVSGGERLSLFFSAHWRGIVTFFWPIIVFPVVLPLPAEKYMWVAYALLVMACFWVTECIPLPVSGFIPLLIFPLMGVQTSGQTAKSYVNDTILMFLGSLFLAASVEQSGLHKRLAYFAIRTVGYSHYKLLGAMCIVTTFVSMWIQNTAATSMMVPIIFALLRVFEEQKILTIFELNSSGDQQSSDMTCCYFCAATYSATIGGIGTLVGTGTNLVFKGLFAEEFPDAPEYLSFPLFSAFAVPYMILLEICMYLWLCLYYFGFLRPGSATAKATKIPDIAKAAAKTTIEKDTKKLGSLTFWEFMVVILFGGAMILFFCRSPQVFLGWGDLIIMYFKRDNDMKFIRDSALAMLISSLMLLLPSNLSFFKNFTAKFVEELPKKPVRSVLDWVDLNKYMPYSFMFLLGGGFALSGAAKLTGLNDKLGTAMAKLDVLPIPVVLLLTIIVTIFVTNFASNVAVANVFVPIAMNMALKLQTSPLWFNIAAGYSASYCFMLPVGTPGNLIVQSSAKIPTGKMIMAGSGVTVTTIILTWFFLYFWAPIIWPIIHEKNPNWISKPEE